MGAGKSKATPIGGGTSKLEAEISSRDTVDKELYDKRKEYIQKRFPGMNAHELSNNYWTMDRVNEDETSVIVKVNGDAHLQKTQYGYALLLDEENVVFLKDFQVNRNYYGDEVRLNKEYFKVKKWGNWDNKGLMGVEPENHKWSRWVDVAKQQQNAGTIVHWQKTGAEKMVQSFQKQNARKKANKSFNKIYDSLTEKEKKDFVTINGRKYIRKIAQNAGLI